MMKKKVVLVAVIGTSPAVLTETVWALAHLDEPVLPDEVVAITTQSGAAAIRNQLFGEKDGWKRLLVGLKRKKIDTQGRLVFGDTQHSIRVLADRLRQRDLNDIATTDDNAQAADDILEILRGYTEDPGTQVYASIAGGRKTMSALMLSCMSLLGRNGDHVLHVLVNAPFDGGVEPVFLFPERGVRYAPRSGGAALSAKDAKISLIDLPFVKMRGWYQDKFKTLPPRYGDLVVAAQSAGPEATVQKPMLKFDFRHGMLFVDEVQVKLSPVEFMTLTVDLFLDPENLFDTLTKIQSNIGAGEDISGWTFDFARSDRFNAKEKEAAERKLALTHTRSDLRKKLGEIPSLAQHVDTLVPRARAHGTWPNERMSADIAELKKRVGMV